MEFARTSVLYALVLIPIVAGMLLYAARKRRHELALFAGSQFADELAPGRSWRRSFLKGILVAGAFTLIILGLAGPRFGSQLVKVQREGIDIVIALDTSLSMLAEDMKPNRLERAKMEIIDLIRELKGDRVGIVVFAGSAFPLCPLTVDYEAALMFAKAIDVNMVSEPGTAIGEAISTSAAMFEKSSKKDRAIILVTDGESHGGNPVKEAEAAAREGIRIYTIGIGSPSGDLIPLREMNGTMQGYKKDSKGETVMTHLDEGVLKAVSAASGGKYLPATREGLELKALYGELSGMQKKKIKGEFLEQKKDRFMYFLGASFLLLLVEMLISTRGSTRFLDKKKLLHTGLAVVLLMAAQGIFPRDALARNVDRAKTNAGNKYFASEAYDKALVLYREALGDSTQLPRHYQGVLYNEGNTLNKLGKYKEALDLYEGSYDAQDSLLTGSMLHNRGNTLMKMNRISDAAGSYTQALNYLPNDPDVMHNLEIALRKLEQQEQQKQQQNQQKQQQEQNQNEKRDQKGEKKGKQNEQEGQQKEGGKEKQQNQQQAGEKSDSTAAMNPARKDTTNNGQEASHEKFVKLSKEDALRILQALEEREKNLQREKRKAAFKKVRKSGKDW